MHSIINFFLSIVIMFYFCFAAGSYYRRSTNLPLQTMPWVNCRTRDRAGGERTVFKNIAVASLNGCISLTKRQHVEANAGLDL